MFAKSTEGRTQELRRPCQLFADRTQGGARQTALGPARECPVLRIADESADMAISTRMDPSRHFVQQLRPAISIALSALAVLAMTAFIILLDLTTVCLEPA